MRCVVCVARARARTAYCVWYVRVMTLNTHVMFAEPMSSLVQEALIVRLSYLDVPNMRSSGLTSLLKPARPFPGRHGWRPLTKDELTERVNRIYYGAEEKSFLLCIRQHKSCKRSVSFANKVRCGCA